MQEICFKLKVFLLEDSKIVRFAVPVVTICEKHLLFFLICHFSVVTKVKRQNVPFVSQHLTQVTGQ